MVLPLGQVVGHRSLVLDLYRTLLRNAVYSPLLEKDRWQLLTRIRTQFRTQRGQTNGEVIIANIRKGNRLNDLIVDSYTMGGTLSKGSDLGMFINPNFYSTSYTKREQPVVGTKMKPNTTPVKIYLKTQQLRPYKTSHDKKYTQEILPSVIKHQQQMAYLNKLRTKLEKDHSGAKLRKVNGTSINIYMVNTPWNGDLRTQSGKWLADVRREYDESITEFNQLQSQRDQYLQWASWETQWEELVGTNGEPGGENWSWAYKQSEYLIKAKITNLNKRVNVFNMKQRAILQELTPEFDSNHVKSQGNIQRLFNVIDQLGVGPYTDISSQRNLGELMQSHQFRNKYV